VLHLIRLLQGKCAVEAFNYSLGKHYHWCIARTRGQVREGNGRRYDHQYPRWRYKKSNVSPLRFSKISKSTLPWISLIISPWCSQNPLKCDPIETRHKMYFCALQKSAPRPNGAHSKRLRGTYPQAPCAYRCENRLTYWYETMKALRRKSSYYIMKI